MTTIHIGLLAALAVAAPACGDDGDGSTTANTDANTSNPNTSNPNTSNPGSDSDSGTVPEADCESRCTMRATTCMVPEGDIPALCDGLCGGSLTDAALVCIEALPCTAGTDEVDACVNDNPPGGDPTTGSGGEGAFGDDCSCDSNSGEWQCSGTDICSEGLTCVGSGMGPGTCVGPTCCEGESDCAAKLGTQSNCGSGQKCACERGDLECVGEECTCSGGVVPSSGLCWPE